MKLYELTEEYARVLELAEDGEDIGDVLAMLGDRLDDKADRCMAVLKNLEADEACARAEADRLSRLAKSRKGQSKRLRDYILACMDASGVTRIKGPRFTITAKDGPEGVTVEDVDQVPDEYLKAPKREADKTAIKRAWKENGECVPGTHVARKRVLAIR